MCKRLSKKLSLGSNKKISEQSLYLNNENDERSLLWIFKGFYMKIINVH